MVDPLDADVIEARIREYESFGIHRTGWKGDDETTRWLARTLERAAVTCRSERFEFSRVEYRRAHLAWGGDAIDGIPLYDGGFTRPGGLSGELCEDGDDDCFGKIVVATSALRGDARWSPREVPARLQALKEGGAVGVVLPSDDGEGEVVLRNAEAIGRPVNLPVLQLPGKAMRELSSAILLQVEATLEIDGERLKSRATNVVASIPGSDSAARPVVVMTPKSGWFTCAAERGGGIAIWLAIAERAAALPSEARRRTLEFVASSGHELHHTGLQAYLKGRPTLAKRAIAWMHLGASIGARFPNARMGASDTPLHDLATKALADAGVEGFTTMPAGDPGFGEARNIHDLGARYVTFLGGHRFFHSPNDTVDRAVDATSVARWGEAAWSIVRGMLALEDGDQEATA